MPKIFREQLGNKLIATRGYEGCLMIVSMAQWQELTRQVGEGSIFESAVRESSRLLLGGASEVVCDTQGRFIIPSPLVDYAMLSDEVVFIGLGRWVEVWQPQAWRKHYAQLVEQGSALAARLSETS